MAYIFAKVNPSPALIESFLAKRQRQRTRKNSADIPLEQLEPRINQTQNPIIIPGHMYPHILPPSAPFEQLTRANSFLNRIVVYTFSNNIRKIRNKKKINTIIDSSRYNKQT